MIPKDIQHQILIVNSREVYPLDELRRWLELVEADEAEVVTLQTSIAERLKPRGVRESPDEERERLDGQQDIKSLASGVTRQTRISDPRLVSRIDQLPLSQLQRTKVRLQNAIAAAEERATVDLDAVHAYRYTGADGKHKADGRWLVHGDVVQLTTRQAAAFADRFEPVVSEAVTG